MGIRKKGAPRIRTCIVLPFALSLIILLVTSAPASAQRASRRKPPARTQEEIRKRLAQPVAFEFKCEPFRDVLRFLTTISGINIFVDENIFELLGKYEDCSGKSVNQPEIFVTVQASNMSLESALHAMLKQHGLVFSVERDHVFITASEEVVEKEGRTKEDRPRPARRANIKVKSVFDPTMSGTYMARLEIGGRKQFVKEGDQFDDYEVLRIDGEGQCVTLRKSGSAREEDFCVTTRVE